MKILILGGDGMLGHQLFRQWSARHEVCVTLRGDPKEYRHYRLFGTAAFGNIDIREFQDLVHCVANYKPEVIVNAVGLVKQRPTTHDCIANLEVNALLPHRLAYLGLASGSRIVHFSTDCVFSGEKGGYSETDLPDATDLYGQAKFLGEMHYPHSLTLRMSVVGRELSRKASLMEWFMAQRGPVQGYRRAIYTGFTTLEMARIVEMLITKHPDASGLWHVSSEAISKHDLLGLVRKHFNLNTDIVPSDALVCDRSLRSERFRSRFGYAPPTWDKMIQELAQDNGFYK